jgi:hypothetical protein
LFNNHLKITRSQQIRRAKSVMKAFDELPSEVRRAVSITNGEIPFDQGIEPNLHACLIYDAFGHIIIEKVKK